MKGRAIVSGVLLAAVVFGLGYWLATGKPLNHGIVFLALLAGFVVCDRSFLPRRFR